MVEKLWDKAKAFIGLEEQEEGEEVAAVPREGAPLVKPRKRLSREEAVFEIDLYEPKVYEDSLSISAKLREGSAVIINLKYLDADSGTRLIDFLCGTAFALDGRMVRIAESIFLFSPQNVLMNDMEEKGSLEQGVHDLERGPAIHMTR